LVSSTTPRYIDKMLSHILGLKLIKKGAESEIRLGTYLNIKAIFKLRRRKSYMHPKLDLRLRSLRTKREAQAILRSLRTGARVPRLLAVYPSLGLIVLEYIEGPTLKTYLDEYGLDEGLLKEAGRILGYVHKAGVVHGDPTTSNYIVSSRGLYLIDFGLAEFRSDIENRAVDIHLFRRALESTHADISDKCFELFKEGYIEIMGNVGHKVINRAKEIELRGRYIEARRKSVWRAMSNHEF
jgi:TP53 regulating kinase-like protein